MIAQQEFKPSSTRSVKINRFLFSNSTETSRCGISCCLNQPNSNNHKNMDYDDGGDNNHNNNNNNNYNNQGSAITEVFSKLNYRQAL